MPARDITEGIPFDLAGEGGPEFSSFRITEDAFDVSIGNLPFVLYQGENNPYRRQGAQWRKEQFDNQSVVGEQSLVGWWLRSQSAFNAGTGITYYEPLQTRDILIEQRFRNSHGLDVLRPDGEVRLLPEVTEIEELSNSTVDVVASETRLLILDGTAVTVWDGTSSSSVTIPNGEDANSLAYTGDRFLIGHETGIAELDPDTGTTATALWTDATDPVQPFWAKQRIFATEAQKIYALSLAGGDLSVETEIYEHPNTAWQWTGITETGGAVWAAGHGGGTSAVHVIVLEDDGTAPTLTAATVGIQLPAGEHVNALLGYLDLLLIPTNRGFRIAAVDNAQAALGPLIFTDPSHSVIARGENGDFVWVGLDNGLTRKLDLGQTINELTFAYANDLESDGPGPITAFAWYDDQIVFAHASEGVKTPGTDLLETGTLETGYIRVGTLEDKYFESARITGDVAVGTIETLVIVNEDPVSIASLANFVGSRDLELGRRSERLSLMFRLGRDSSDPTAGPALRGYQLRAMPIPGRRQRLVQLPVACFDRETDRWGLDRGGPGFAWARLRELEQLEEDGVPVLVKDFRTKSNRRCFVEDVSFTGVDPPDREHHNVGGVIIITIRTID